MSAALDSLQIPKDFSELYRNGVAYNLVAAVSLILLIVLLPQVIQLVLGYAGIGPKILIWMLAALSFAFLYGYIGLLSFGHSTFLGTGAYGTAMLMYNLDIPYLLTVGVTLIATLVISHVIASLISKKGEIYYALLTMAFSMFFWFVAYNDPFGLTGGYGGIVGDVRPSWFQVELGERMIVVGGYSIGFYWFVGVIVVLCAFAIFRIVRSPFGRTMIAIRENEELARSIGIDTYRYKVHAFNISAFFMAIAGVLLALNLNGTNPELYHWVTSGDIVLMSILGGISSFAGPLVGGIFWILGSEFLVGFRRLSIPMLGTYMVSDYLNYWRFLFGAIFIAVIYFAPQRGVWGMLKGVAVRIANAVR